MKEVLSLFSIQREWTFYIRDKQGKVSRQNVSIIVSMVRVWWSCMNMLRLNFYKKELLWWWILDSKPLWYIFLSIKWNIKRDIKFMYRKMLQWNYLKYTINKPKKFCIKSLISLNETNSTTHLRLEETQQSREIT